MDEIQAEYASFVEAQDNLILFGSETDLKDIKRCTLERAEGSTSEAKPHAPFVIVPVTRDQFTMLSDSDFLKLIRIFGISSNQRQNVYPRIVGVKLADFKEQLQLMKQAIPKLLSEESREQQKQQDADDDTIMFDLATVK